MTRPIDKWVIQDIDTRKHTISEQVAKPDRLHRIHELRNTAYDLPVIRIPIYLPLYRVANYRTNLHQLEWLRKNDLNPEYFKMGEENESVQKVQHAFLWELASADKELAASIVERLRTQKQREPLLISASGVVVNGNRRLAAMRELFWGQEDISEFADIDCMILPTWATEEDFREIEVRLQMTPETRLSYDWIGECLAIKDLRGHNVEFSEIANWMNMDPAKVKNKLLMLNEVDIYLREWRGKEYDYSYLKDAEEIVAQITKRLKSKDGAQQEIARRMAWILLDQKGNDGRVYELRDVTGNLTTEVTAKLNEVFHEEIKSHEKVEDNVELEFEFEDNSDNDEDSVSDQAIVAFLQNAKGNEEIQKEIVGLCKVVVEAKKIQKSGESAKRLVQEAHTSLLEVDLTSASPSTYDSILKHLDQILGKAAQLKEQVQRLTEAQNND
jgi:hypothetical protein